MPQRLVLAHFLPYRLSIAMQAVSDGLASRYSAEFGIGIPEWRIVAVLGEKQEMTARDIAAHARMNKTMVSRAVSSLLTRRIVSRRANEDDRRESFLRLAARGRALYESIAPLALAYERELTSGIARSDLEALDRMLKVLLQRGDAMNIASPPAAKI